MKIKMRMKKINFNNFNLEDFYYGDFTRISSM